MVSQKHVYTTTAISSLLRNLTTESAQIYGLLFYSIITVSLTEVLICVNIEQEEGLLQIGNPNCVSISLGLTLQLLKAIPQILCQRQEVVLEKILCGLEPGEQVDCNIELNNEEKSEAEKLLTSVIHHWGALKNSSPAAVRQTFLLREGKLFKREKDRVLQVQAKTEDILLSRVPWGIGIIKLPWMKNLLFTEWT